MSEGVKPLICTSVALSNSQQCMSGRRGVSVKSLSQWMSHKLTAAKTTRSSQIQGCIHGQGLSLRPQTDTALSKKNKWLLVFLSANMKTTHKSSETGVCRVHSARACSICSPNPSTVWSTAGLRVWPHLIQKNANIRVKHGSDLQAYKLHSLHSSQSLHKYQTHLLLRIWIFFYEWFLHLFQQPHCAFEPGFEAILEVTPHTNLGIIQGQHVFCSAAGCERRAQCSPVSLSLDSNTSVTVVRRKGLVLKVK